MLYYYFKYNIFICTQLFVKRYENILDKFNVPSKTKLLKEAATIAYTAKLQKTPAEKVEISQQFGQFYYTECIKSSLALPATK